MHYVAHHNGHQRINQGDFRIRVVAIIFVIGLFLIITRLFVLMIVEHGFYSSLASGSQEMYAKLFPRRGEIFIQDSRTHEEYPLAINQDVFTIFADTRQIKTADAVSSTLAELSRILNYDDARRDAVRIELLKPDDPYQPLEENVLESKVDELKALKISGLGFVRVPHRYYPEGTLAASVVGFVGKDDTTNSVGKYGVEGYWNTELAGSGGFLEGARGAKGSWIPLAGRLFDPAKDGSDILLTIDRTLEFKACERLRVGLREYGATSAALIIMDPKTGAIRAMCSLPDFDPNTYNRVDSVDVYNNSAVFTPYEPGSVMKPMVMAGALNENTVTPDSIFHDSGVREGICSTPIKNAGEKSYGDQTMTGVLENSINTGMVYVAEKLGKPKLIDYIASFGFGIKTGLELDSEASGTTDSLHQNKGNRLDCYAATASFGQGFTVTPLQMVTAFSALANGGVLMKPYIIEEVRHADGMVEKTRPTEIRRVIDRRTSSLISGMLVRVVDHRYGGRARVNGYYVAGKSGTAQIPGPGGYTEETNHSFIGFAPVNDPKFVMIVKYEKPQRTYAESSAAPVFGELSKFILDYYQVPPER